MECCTRLNSNVADAVAIDRLRMGSGVAWQRSKKQSSLVSKSISCLTLRLMAFAAGVASTRLRVVSGRILASPTYLISLHGRHLHHLRCA